MEEEQLNIQRPQDIEKYLVIRESTGILDPQAPPRQIIAWNQQQIQCLYSIRSDLGRFDNILESIILGRIQAIPINESAGVEAKRQDQLRKALACKTKAVGEYLKNSQNHITQLEKLEKEREKNYQRQQESIQQKQRLFNFASNDQLRLYCRAVELPANQSTELYANFYHDRFRDLDLPLFYKVRIKDYRLEIQQESMKKVLFIKLSKEKKGKYSVALQVTDCYEKILYEYLRRFPPKEIKGYMLEFNYVDENALREVTKQSNLEHSPLLFIQLLWELIMNPEGSMKNYYDFVESMI